MFTRVNAVNFYHTGSRPGAPSHEQTWATKLLSVGLFLNNSEKMPPKKKDQPSKKTEIKKKDKVVEVSTIPCEYRP